MKIALISLSNEGARIAERLAETLGDCQVYLHESVSEFPQERRFERICDLTEELFRPSAAGAVDDECRMANDE